MIFNLTLPLAHLLAYSKLTSTPIEDTSPETIGSVVVIFLVASLADYWRNVYHNKAFEAQQRRLCAQENSRLRRELLAVWWRVVVRCRRRTKSEGYWRKTLSEGVMA
jgi:uncharacterized membrane protein